MCLFLVQKEQETMLTAGECEPRSHHTGHNCFYRTLAEGTLDIITVVDELGTIVYKSPSAEQQLGHRPEDFVGRNLFECIHPDDISRARATFDECRRNDAPTAPMAKRNAMNDA